MTPKEKAEELINKYHLLDAGMTYDEINWINAKQCALIAVDEILNAVNNPDETYLMKHSVEYWSQVKQEIEKL